MTLYEQLELKTKAIDEERFTVDGVFSTETKDRHGDIIKQDWDLKAYKKNPVILNSHRHADIEDIIGRAEAIKVVSGQLQGRIKFAVHENPKAKIAWELVKAGYLNTFSVGFIPKEFDEERQVITKSELLEISLVTVPANPEALIMAKSAGIKNISDLYDIPTKSNGDDIENEEDNGETAETDSNDSKDTRTESEQEIVESSGNEEVEEGSSDEGAKQRHEEEEGQSEEEVGKNEVSVEEKRVELLKLIVKKTKEVGELSKVETRETVRAKNLRLINKAIRNLIKNKKSI